MRADRIPLGALSARQRRIIERNLPLVHLTIGRHGRLSDPDAVGRERSELFQEGCLALIEAVRTHDPSRHGSFAAFAMARVRFAISRFVHEHQSPVRVPFVTQRRQRCAVGREPERRHRPGTLPRVVDEPPDPARVPAADRNSHPAESCGETVTVGELIRERFDRALRRVVDEMRHDPRCAEGNREVVDRCVAERWTVPEAAARTPIRQLARTLACSMGRITHCEERFRRRIAAELEADRTYQALSRLARSRPSGFRHALQRRERARRRAASREPSREAAPA